MPDVTLPALRDYKIATPEPATATLAGLMGVKKLREMDQRSAALKTGLSGAGKGLDPSQIAKNLAETQLKQQEIDTNEAKTLIKTILPFLDSQFDREDYPGIYKHLSRSKILERDLVTPEEFSKLTSTEEKFVRAKSALIKMAEEFVYDRQKNVAGGDKLSITEKIKEKAAAERRFGNQPDNILRRSLVEQLGKEPTNAQWVKAIEQKKIRERLFGRVGAHEQRGAAPGTFREPSLRADILGIKEGTDGKLYVYNDQGKKIDITTNGLLTVRAVANEMLTVAATRKRQQATGQAKDLLFRAKTQLKALSPEEFSFLRRHWNSMITGKMKMLDNPQYAKYRIFSGLIPSLMMTAHGVGATDSQKEEFKSMMGSPVETFSNMIAKFDALNTYIDHAAQSVVRPKALGFGVEGVYPSEVKFKDGRMVSDAIIDRTGSYKVDVVLSKVQDAIAKSGDGGAKLFEKSKEALKKAWKKTKDAEYLNGLRSFMSRADIAAFVGGDPETQELAPPAAVEAVRKDRKLLKQFEDHYGYTPEGM